MGEWIKVEKKSYKLKTREKIVCSGHNVDIDLPVSSIELMIAVYSFCLIAWPGQFD